MKNVMLISAVVLFLSAILSCESDDFEILKDRNSNSITMQVPGETETETLVEITDDELLLPESVSEISRFSTGIVIKTAVPKQNVYLNKIYRGKTPLAINDLVEGFYELSIEYVNTEDALKNNKTVKKNYLINVKYGEVQNYYFGE